MIARLEILSKDDASLVTFSTDRVMSSGRAFIEAAQREYFLHFRSDSSAAGLIFEERSRFCFVDSDVADISEEETITHKGAIDFS